MGAQLMSVGQVSSPHSHFLLWTRLVSERSPDREERAGWECCGETGS